MKTYWFAILCFPLVLACSGSRKPVTFFTDAKAFDPEVSIRPVLNYKDMYGLRNASIKLDSISKVVIDYPVLFQHKDQFLVFPKETIQIDMNEKEDYIFSVKNNHKRNRGLAFFKEFDSIRLNHPNLFDPRPNVSGLGFDDAKQKLVQYQKYRLSGLDSLLKKSNIGSKTKKIARIYYRSRFAPVISFSDTASGSLSRRLLVDQINSIKSVEEIQYGHEYFISAYADKMFGIGWVRTVEDYITAKDMIAGQFDGIVKDFLLSKMVYNLLYRRKPLPENFLREYYRDCKTPKFERAIKKYVKGLEELDKKSMQYGKNPLYDNDLELISLESVLEKHRGKIIVVDIWASWCLPCVEGFRSGNELKKNYAPEDLVFIYLSTDKDIQQWLVAEEKYGLPQEGSFAFVHFNDSEYAKEYKIDAIPRYILIGRDGKVITGDAPAPGDDTLKKMISENL